MTQFLTDTRREYTRDGLSEANAPNDPFNLLRQWFDDVVKIEHLPIEPNAMTPATVDADGYPHCRILLLKGLDERDFTFLTNYENAKDQQLVTNPRMAMTFFWPALGRQVCTGGSVEKVIPEKPDVYCQVHLLGGHLGAQASPQSRVIADHAEPRRLLVDTKWRSADQPPSCPRYWDGYYLLSQRIGSWQGRPSRLHDRFGYRHRDGDWPCEHLAP